MPKSKYKYEKDDEPFRPIHYYYDMLNIAQKNGFNSVKSAVTGLYKHTGTIYKTAEILKVTPQSIQKMLVKFGTERRPVGCPSKSQAVS